MLFSFFPLRNHQRIWVKLQKPTRIIHISCRPLTFENITLIFSACHLASSSAGISTQWGRVYSLIFLGRCPEHHPSLIFVMVSNGCMNRVLWEVPANQLRKHLQIESPQGNLTAHHFQKKKVSFLDFFFSIFWGWWDVLDVLVEKIHPKLKKNNNQTADSKRPSGFVFQLQSSLP